MIGPFSRLSRRRRRRRAEERYWDFFLNTAPADPLNALSDAIRRAPEGAVNSVRSDIHTPEIMSEHVREIAKRFGADEVGVIALDPAKDVPEDVSEKATSAVICVVPADHDPDTSPGIGGQVPDQNGLLVSFILAAYFRESGYFATTRTGPATDLAALAVRAGLGSLDSRGRLSTARRGTKVWVADAIYTDFPLLGRS